MCGYLFLIKAPKEDLLYHKKLIYLHNVGVDIKSPIESFVNAPFLDYKLLPDVYDTKRRDWYLLLLQESIKTHIQWFFTSLFGAFHWFKSGRYPRSMGHD